MPFEPVLNGWVQKMRAEGGAGKGKGKKKRKEKEKGGKNGDQNHFFFSLQVCAHVFSYAQWSFFKYIRKTVS